MKAKTNTQGMTYFFYEDDYELDAIALKLISLLPKHSGSIGKPLKMKLWDCAFDLIENTPDNSIIFKRCSSIYEETNADRVFNLMADIINTIVKLTNTEGEKQIKVEWNENLTRKTKNNILVRYTTKGKFVALKTLTDVLIGSITDITNILQRVGTTIDDITITDFNKLVDAVKNDQSALGDDLVKHEFKTIKVFFEDLITEKNLQVETTTRVKKKFGLKVLKDLGTQWDDDIDLF